MRTHLLLPFAMAAFNAAAQGGGCPEAITLEITLDLFGSQTTWSLFDNSGNTEVDSGGPYADDAGGTVIVEDLCLGQLCYRLEVFDAGGDGITGGGYVLKNAVGRRIIVANGQFGSTSAMADGQRFCLPVSAQGLIQTWCDRTNLLYTSHTQVYASAQPGAKAYQFWFFDPHGSYSRRVFLPQPVVTPFNLLTNPVPADLDLNVRVRAFYEGGAISNWGRACVIRLNTPGSRNANAADMEPANTMADDAAIGAYPNPNNGRAMRLRWEGTPPGAAVRMDVMDMQGRLVNSQPVTFSEGSEEVAVTFTGALSPGMYLVSVSGQGITRATRLMVE